MVETGKRMPSSDLLDMLAGVFSKDARWFLDENTEVEATPAQRARGGLEAMPWNRHFCSRTSCCRTRYRNCCRKTAPPAGNLRNC